jgi:hypothetical protein
MIPSRTVSIYGIYPQIAHLGEAASKIVVSSLYEGEEEKSHAKTQRRKDEDKNRHSRKEPENAKTDRALSSRAA